MTRQTFIVVAALGSALMLAAAFGFQYIAELPPCKMCIWQRWPHGAAVLIGLVGALVYHRGIALLGALAALTTAFIGLYHAGVERDWWEGPSTCTAGSTKGLSTQELLTKILEAPIVRCDEIPWELFGLSMAGWNALISFGFAALWLFAARR